MTEPIVDIILPTNRAGEFLPTTLESVVRQTWPHWRLTVVDDGSPDPVGLARLVGEVPEARVLRQSARGVSTARNRGVQETDGSLIVFLDDDDLWSAERLERQVTAWLGAQHHVGVYCAGEHINSCGRTIGTPWPAYQATAESLLRGDDPLPRFVTMLLTREICLAVGGFDERLTTGEDLDFTLKVLQFGEMLAVPECLMQYRRHGSNVSRSGDVVARLAIRKFLDGQIADAVARGDKRAAALLTVHRDRRRPLEAAESVSGTIEALRDGDALGVLRELRWAARTPKASIAEIASRGWRHGKARRT